MVESIATFLLEHDGWEKKNVRFSDEIRIKADISYNTHLEDDHVAFDFMNKLISTNGYTLAEQREDGGLTVNDPQGNQFRIYMLSGDPHLYVLSMEMHKSLATSTPQLLDHMDAICKEMKI